MTDFRNIARQFIKNGLWVIPVNTLKKPACKSWFDFQTRPMNNDEIELYFKKCYGIALLCGGYNRVELLDWDLKYDLSGDFYDRVKAKVPEVIKRKMFVQTTKNKGFHWWYKIPEECVSPNQKLANRYTTPHEKHQTYLEYYKDPKTRDNAMKIAVNDTHRVICETRGGLVDRAGGYGLISPTEGYEVVYKPKGGFQELTKGEHETLLNIIREFNEVVELDITLKKKFDNVSWEVDPFEDYNERGDALGLLYECGWEEVGKSNKSIRLKRPGADSGSSGLYDLESDIFNCFSTSTRFDCNKGYTPSSVFVELECDGDSSVAYRKLVELGYGVKK